MPSLGQFHKLIYALRWTICALRPTFTPQKGFSKVGRRARSIGLGRKTVYEIDPLPYLQTVPLDWFSLSHLALACLPLSPKSGIFFVIFYYFYLFCKSWIKNQSSGVKFKVGCWVGGWIAVSCTWKKEKKKERKEKKEKSWLMRC